MSVVIPVTKCEEGWRVVAPIGEPSMYGTVSTACCGTECDYVIKKQIYSPGNSMMHEITRKTIQHEATMQYECAKHNLCLPVVDIWYDDEAGYIMTKVLSITVGTYLEKLNDFAGELKEASKGTFSASDIDDKCITPLKRRIVGQCLGLLSELHRVGYTHGDAHLNNFMIEIIGEDKITPAVLSKRTSLSEKFSLLAMSVFRVVFIDMGETTKLSDSKTPESNIATDFVVFSTSIGMLENKSLEPLDHIMIGLVKLYRSLHSISTTGYDAVKEEAIEDIDMWVDDDLDDDSDDDE